MRAVGCSKAGGGHRKAWGSMVWCWAASLSRRRCARGRRRARRRRRAGGSCSDVARASAAHGVLAAPQAVWCVESAGARAMCHKATLRACGRRRWRRGRAGSAAGGGIDACAVGELARRSCGGAGGGEKPSYADHVDQLRFCVHCAECRGGARAGRGGAMTGGGALRRSAPKAQPRGRCVGGAGGCGVRGVRGSGVVHVWCVQAVRNRLTYSRPPTTIV